MEPSCWSLTILVNPYWHSAWSGRQPVQPKVLFQAVDRKRPSRCSRSSAATDDGGICQFCCGDVYVRGKSHNGQNVPTQTLLALLRLGVTSADCSFQQWTSDKNVPWIAPCIGATFMGFGFFTIFQAALNYLIDTFQKYAASAIAANTFLRSCFAGAFPLFATPMYHKLGVPVSESPPHSCTSES